MQAKRQSLDGIILQRDNAREAGPWWTGWRSSGAER